VGFWMPAVAIISRPGSPAGRAGAARAVLLAAGQPHIAGQLRSRSSKLAARGMGGQLDPEGKPRANPTAGPPAEGAKAASSEACRASMHRLSEPSTMRRCSIARQPVRNRLGAKTTITTTTVSDNIADVLSRAEEVSGLPRRPAQLSPDDGFCLRRRKAQIVSCQPIRRRMQSAAASRAAGRHNLSSGRLCRLIAGVYQKLYFTSRAQCALHEAARVAIRAVRAAFERPFLSH